MVLCMYCKYNEINKTDFPCKAFWMSMPLIDTMWKNANVLEQKGFFFDLAGFQVSCRRARFSLHVWNIYCLRTYSPAWRGRGNGSPPGWQTSKGTWAAIVGNTCFPNCQEQVPQVCPVLARSLQNLVKVSRRQSLSQKYVRSSPQLSQFLNKR